MAFNLILPRSLRKQNLSSSETPLSLSSQCQLLSPDSAREIIRLVGCGQRSEVNEMLFFLSRPSVHKIHFSDVLGCFSAWPFSITFILFLCI